MGRVIWGGHGDKIEALLVAYKDDQMRNTGCESRNSTAERGKAETLKLLYLGHEPDNNFPGVSEEHHGPFMEEQFVLAA